MVTTADIMNFLEQNIVVIAIVVFALAVLYLFLRRNPGKYKRISLEQEIKKELDFLYNQFSNPVNRLCYAGMVKMGVIMGEFPVYWDSSVSFIMNLKRNRQFEKYIRKHGEVQPDVKEFKCFKIHKSGRFNRIKALLGFGTSYHLVPNKLITSNKDYIVLDSHINPSTLYKVVIYDKSGRDLIENMAYKMSRQEELEELVNYIPKSAYLETSVSGAVARDREKAQIEREKYKGQVESAESS